MATAVYFESKAPFQIDLGDTDPTFAEFEDLGFMLKLWMLGPGALKFHCTELVLFVVQGHVDEPKGSLTNADS